MKDTSEKLNSDSPAAKWYRTFTKAWPKPSAIVIVSAHWEGKSTVLVTTGAKHPLLYDYYGFPPNTYELGYDCPGQPALAGRILELLREAGIPAGEESSRGYDHGVFIPLKLMYPDADIPVVQVGRLYKRRRVSKHTTHTHTITHIRGCCWRFVDSPGGGRGSLRERERDYTGRSGRRRVRGARGKGGDGGGLGERGEGGGGGC